MASGSVLIWEEDYVCGVWEDGIDLANQISGMYIHRLGDKRYLVVYESTESGFEWDEPDWRYVPDRHKERLVEFIRWLRHTVNTSGNQERGIAAEWEVWS